MKKHYNDDVQLYIGMTILIIAILFLIIMKGF